jgi:transcriptional regulator with XRE-family HTH domain
VQGLNEGIPIGERVRELRRWRGLTLSEVAGLAGITKQYLSMIENGRRPLDRRSLISALATALRVSETEIVGGPHLGTDKVQSAPHLTVPPLRDALQASSPADAAVDHARALPELARLVTGHIEPARAEDRIAEAGELLPAVIEELHWHVAQPKDEAARKLALETLVEACVIGCLIAKDLGYHDLAYVAVLRASEAAALLDDPVARGKADVLRLWAFPRGRSSWERRLAAAAKAADALEPHARDPQGLQVLGMITLHAALAAAVVQHQGDTAHWLAEAMSLAGRVPDDAGRNWLSFSATNAALWRLAITVERGEGGGTVLEMAQAIDPAKTGNRNRRACLYLDTSRGLARDPRMRAEAVRWLHRAEQTAPQLIRNVPAARETVTYLLGREIAAAGGRELRGMAARMGVPH